jgi:hypothetical protein
MLNDFLAKLPIDVIIQTEIEESRIVLPIKIDSKAFYKSFSTQIESDTLTTEKAIYIASTYPTKPMKTAKDLLNTKLRY